MDDRYKKVLLDRMPAFMGVLLFCKKNGVVSCEDVERNFDISNARSLLLLRKFVAYGFVRRRTDSVGGSTRVRKVIWEYIESEP